ncbi:TPA: hypothetical protein QCU60_004294 [Bacillus cereus]|nr:hypothetical protein [Bacillus cereus]
MSSSLKWIIYTVLGISILLISFVAYGVYLFYKLKCFVLKRGYSYEI